MNSNKDWQQEKNTELLASLAIDAALTSDWQEAVKINEKILKEQSSDVEALNRLAKAQSSTGEITKAQKTYGKVLNLDPYNIIAKKNLDKLTKMPNNGHTNGSNGNSNGHANDNGHAVNLSTIFLFEPGKTKIISLLNLAPPTILAGLNCGDKLTLNVKKHTISVLSEDGNYLGAMPDDLSHKLMAYIDGGNKYEVYVKFATPKSLTIFIRESERSTKFSNQPTFQETRTLYEDSFYA